MKFEVTNFCEIDKYAVDSYCRIHNEQKSKNLGDITTAKEEDVAACNVVVGGSPCFTGNSLVLTKSGYKPLSAIQLGEMVLSHDGQFHKVLDVLIQGEKYLTKVCSKYFLPISTTANHRFYVKKENAEPEWIEVLQLTNKDYVGCYVGCEQGLFYNVNLLYLYGLYMKYGTETNRTQVTFTIPKSEQQYLQQILKKQRFKWSVSDTPMSQFVQVDIQNDVFHTFYHNLDVFSLTTDEARVVLDGFQCLAKNQFEFTSKNLCLIYNISYLVMKAEKCPCVFTEESNMYTINWETKNNQDFYFENGYLWFSATSEQTVAREMVYDLTVEDSHSFVVQNCIVHNCQDFSVAGKRKGAMWTCTDCRHQYNPLEVHYSNRETCPKCHSTQIERTRSSLIVEYLRMIREKKPNFAVYENVKNLVGKDFKVLFHAFLEELHEYGYNTYYQVLNAKHFGIPQNRERVILIIIKKDLDNGKFVFPEPFDAGIRLKNVLEDNVHQKYYLNQSLQDNFRKNMENPQTCDKQIQDLLQRLDPETIDNIVNDGKICVASRGRYKENPNLRIAGLPTEQRLEPNLNGTTNTLTTVQKDNLILEHKVVVDDGIKPCVRKNFEREKDLIAASDKEIYQCKCDSGWQDNKVGIQVSPTLRANNPFTCVYNDYCIRRLTPLECFRLMGFDDEDFHHARNGDFVMSDTQLYKQAGNSIVTNVLYYTYLNLYKAMPYLFEDIKLLSLFSGIGAFEKAFRMLQKYIENPNYIPNDYRTTEAENKPVRVGQVSSEGSQAGTVYSEENISPTLCAGCHGYAMGYILTENFPKPPTS